MIDCLSLELLQQIFALSCPPIYRISDLGALPFQFTIAHVSSAWRKASLGYTALWSNIDLVSLEYWDIPARARKSMLLQFAIAASAPAPLSLSLTVSSLWKKKDPVAFELLEMAALVSPRWRHAKINIIAVRHIEGDQYDEVVRILCSIRNRIPQLESLGLHTPFARGLEDTLLNAPSLRHINGIYAYSGTRFELPWSQLQTLKLTVHQDVSASEFQAYLQNVQACTTLEIIILDGSYFPTAPNGPEPSINLPRVHTATLKMPVPLSLPSLQTLSIGRMLAQNPSLLIDMLVRSRAMLSTLYCPDTVFLDQRVANACSSLPHLVVYTAEQWSTSLAPVETVLKWLHDTGDSTKYSRLESLHIVHYVEAGDSLSADSVFACVDILKQARSKTLKRINIMVYDALLALAIGQSLRPSPEMKERLERGPCAVDIVFSIGPQEARHHVVRNVESEHDDLPEKLRDWEEHCAVLSR